MATKTSDLLQKPSIIEIKGSTLRIAHPDTSSCLNTRLAAAIAAAGVTATVLDNMAGVADIGGGLVDNDWLRFGEIGNEQTETVDINGAVARGTSITITNSLSFAHELDCPVTQIFERGIKIYGAATDGGAGTLIASIDAITVGTRQLADATMIQWHKEYTEYTMISTDTAYAYYYVTFTDGVTDSSASDYVLAAGQGKGSAQNMIYNALHITNSNIGGKLSQEILLAEVDNCQDEIVSFVNSRGFAKDWSWEIAEDDTSISLTENENKYALSGFSFTLKETDSKNAIQSLKIGSNKLTWIDVGRFEDDMSDVVKTAVKTAITTDDTSIVLDDTYELSESGTVIIGADTISYTGNTEATGTLTGCTDVDSDHAVDATVWQGISSGLPTKYTIINEYIYLNKPVDTDYVGYKLKIRGYKKLDRITELSDVTAVPFYYIFQDYIASKIKDIKNKPEESAIFLSRFLKKLTIQAKRNVTQLKEGGTSYSTSIEDGN